MIQELKYGKTDQHMWVWCMCRNYSELWFQYPIVCYIYSVHYKSSFQLSAGSLYVSGTSGYQIKLIRVPKCINVTVDCVYNGF